MATIGPFHWRSHTNAIPQTEWDYTCTIVGYTPFLNMLQSLMEFTPANTSPSTFSNSVTGLGTYMDQTAGTFYSMLFSGAKGYTSPISAGMTYTDRTGAVTISAATQYSDVLNTIFVATGSGLAPIKSTSGAGNFANLGGSPPSATLVKVVNNFMFLANTSGAVGTQSRLYWSNVVDPETWPAASFVDIRKNDGFGITGLANIGTDLYVFKNTSISRFGTTTFSISGTVSTLGPLETINYYLGVNNGYNVCQMTDGRVAFLASDNNLYIYDGNSLFNASVQSYPNPDLRLAFGGASNSISDSVVCENPYEKIIYLLGVGTSQAFGYDYVNNFWFKTGSYTGVGGGTSTNFYSAVNTIGSSPSFTPSRILIGGGGNNAVYVSNTNDAADTNCIATMTIRLPYRRKEGIPRSAIFELNLGGGLSSANIRARAGINALPSTFGYTNATAAAGRYVIPIALPSLATSGQPTEQNALVELTILAGSAASFGDVYLSDEIQ